MALTHLFDGVVAVTVAVVQHPKPPATVAPGSASNHGEAFGIAIALLIPALGVGWVSAGLPGDSMRKWRDRVDFTFTGLTARAVDALVDLQVRITQEIVFPGGDNPAAEAIADPQPLLELTDRCSELLRVRSRVRGHFRAHRRIGPILRSAVIGYVAGWILATVHYAGVVGSEPVGLTGLAIGGLGALVAVLAWVAYAYLEAKLTAAEELSSADL